MRPSDFSLGDFWEWKNIDSDITKDFGLSQVLVNTEKGIYLFQLIKSKIHYVQADLSKCVQFNMRSSTPEPAHREKVEEDYLNYGFLYIAKKYGNLNIKSQIKDLIKKIIALVIKK